MEWAIYLGLGCMCFVLHKLIIIYINNNQTSDVTQMTRYIWGWIITIIVFGSYMYYLHKTTVVIKDNSIFYVNLFENIDSQKNYRVPGLIQADEDGYKLLQVYWSNGGKLNFYDSYSDLVVGEKIPITDDENKKWYVELTKDKATINK